MIYWIDLFCGAGGVSLGIHKAGQRVLACINHDKNAILSHSANHKDVLHFTEDIRTIPLHPIVKLVAEVRAKDPKAVFALWASLECTNYSKAKGGQSRDADSRTLALHLFRYMEAINFDYIYIENVEEFMAWGSLIAKTEKIKVDGETREVCPLRWNKGKLEPHWIPESRTKGADYIAWIKQVCSYGFHHQHKILNCADFGDPTKRLRYFGIFAKIGKRIVFPTPTYADPKKIDKVSSLFGGDLKPWIPVKKCLDFSDMGKSIFDRKKPLVEKSLRRIYAGLIKYVMLNDKSVEAICDKMTKEIMEMGENIAIPIIPSQVQVKPFITKYMSNSPQTGISVPQDIDNPSGTITTQGRFGLVQAFLAGYYSSKDIESDKGKLSSTDYPSPTLTTVPHQSLIILEYNENISFLNKYYGQEDQAQNAISIDNPAPTLTTKDRISLISTVQYIVNPQYGDKSGCSIESPRFTLIARMDKMPPYVANGLKLGGEMKCAALLVDKVDSEFMIKIKVCMAIYGLCDIKMRMLNIVELKKIQSFPADYILIGSQAEQKKYIGNAVPSETVMNLVKCLN